MVVPDVDLNQATMLVGTHNWEFSHRFSDRCLDGAETSIEDFGREENGESTYVVDEAPSPRDKPD
jgi:ABC-type polar amino acid transport system ATPase subunit